MFGKKGIRLSAKTYFVILLVMFAIFSIFEISFTRRTKAANEELDALRIETAALTETLNEKEHELEFVKTPEGIELYARANGLQKKGETRYKAN